jgi:polyisoprenoid-binding protein YceI
MLHVTRTARFGLSLVLLLLPGAARATQSGASDSLTYILSPASRLDVRTGKAGLLGFAGHEHLIRARAFSGHVVLYPDRPVASHADISISTDSLEVLTPPDTAEIRKVTASMRSDVLDVAQYPEIQFVSRTVERGGEDTLRILGALTMHGRTREVPVVVHVVIAPGRDTLRAIASFTVKQSDFGIRPYRGGPGGTVRVADAVTFDIDAVALRRP